MEKREVGRQPYFDALRGLAIIAVVAIHTSSFHYEVGPALQPALFVFRGLLDFAVPLFFAISGYFLGLKEISAGAAHRAFLRRQIPKIYIPMLVLSVPYLYLENFQYNFWGVAKFFGGGFGTMYFIAVIIQMYLLLPWLQRHADGRGLAVAAAVTLAASLVADYMHFYSGRQWSFLMECGLFTHWLLFFIMGLYFARHSRRFSLFWPLLLILAGVAWQYWETCYTVCLSYSDAFDYKPGSTVMAAGIVWLLFHEGLERRFRVNALSRPLLYLGGISFGIYLINVIPTWYMVRGIAALREYWLLRFAFSLAACIAVIEAVKWVSRPIARRYFGFF